MPSKTSCANKSNVLTLKVQGELPKGIKKDQLEYFPLVFCVPEESPKSSSLAVSPSTVNSTVSSIAHILEKQEHTFQQQASELGRGKHERAGEIQMMMKTPDEYISKLKSKGRCL